MAELEATSQGITLSTFIEVPILILYVSQPASAAHINEAQVEGSPTPVEHTLTTCSYSKRPQKTRFRRRRCVCSPPTRNATDNKASGRASRIAPSVYSVQTIVP